MAGRMRFRHEEFEHLLVERREDGIAVVTLNRPQRLNAVTTRMHTEIALLPRVLQADDEVRAAVIVGAGTSFCSGADMGELEADAMFGEMLVEARNLLLDWVGLDKPVVTAVRGYALGVGATLALLGDVVLAAPSARFGDTHVSNQGVTAGDGGALLWPLLAGLQQARYYLLTGELVPAEEAYRLGLVFRVVEDEALLDEAVAMAGRLSAGAPMAVRSTKTAINRYLSLIANEILPYSIAAEVACFKSEDHLEAMAAFTERRAGRYLGR
ncbi:MAG: enoyl-CoA hydratase/isomerase family protein [Dehalococcoidia bacterium]|nr:enoyl-CoA hydratase/isomerase family protein [Dehalococcoidia bacterium]